MAVGGEQSNQIHKMISKSKTKYNFKHLFDWEHKLNRESRAL